MRVEVQTGYHLITKLRVAPFYPGETLDMDDKEARRLIDAGVVKETSGEAAAGSGSQEKRPNVGDTVALVQAAQTIEELDKLAEGETRAGVLPAIDKRRAELETPEV